MLLRGAVMTAPVWDGRGRDPWLPARLDARLEVQAVEEDIRAAIWAALGEWLTALARRMLRSDAPPDLSAVWAAAPFWAELLEHVLRGEILTALRKGFQRVLGSAAPIEGRAFTNRYLTEVRNRLSRIPDEVYDLVAAQIAAGVNLGEGVPELSARVDDVLSTTASPRWANRAVTIARTESIGALNAGRMEGFRLIVEDDPELGYELLWLSTDDARTRETHVEADGQRVPWGSTFTVGGASLAFPGDPSGPPQEVINCIPGETLVWFPGIRSVMRRWYEGEMVTIQFSTGDQLTITPNHPVLRADGGWTPAGLLQEGDQCICRTGGRHLPGQPHPQHGPSEVREVYRTACLAAVPDRVALAPPDLHGDRPDGDVEVVPVHGHLTFYGQPASDQEVRQFGLSTADLARSTECGADGRPLSIRAPGVEADSHPAPGDVGSGGQPPAFFRAESGHAQPVGFTPGAGGQAEQLKSAGDDAPVHVQGAGHGEDALPPLVSLAQVVKIDRSSFKGHVFNLDTGHGWYTGNSIIVRNCRCVPLLVDEDEVIDYRNRQYRDR